MKKKRSEGHRIRRDNERLQKANQGGGMGDTIGKVGEKAASRDGIPELMRCLRLGRHLPRLTVCLVRTKKGKLAGVRHNIIPKSVQLEYDSLLFLV